jgi:ABC-type sugar transport system permease subunit
MTEAFEKQPPVPYQKTSVWKRFRTLHVQKMIVAYAVVIPAAAYYILFFVYPLFRAVYFSFTNYRMISAPKAFVGLLNYQQLFNDDKWITALKHTFEYTALYVPSVFVLALIMALVINQLTFGRGFFRAVYFAPVMTAGVAVAIIFRYVLHPSLGLGNEVLRIFGLPPSQWYLTPGDAMPTLVLISGWESIGYQMILLLAGLQNIPAHFYDAAKVDGAGIWQRFRYITMPLLQPTLLFVIVTTVIGAFQQFTDAYLFAGAPRQGMSVALTYIYGYGITEGYLGFASAAAIVLFVIIMIFTLIQLRLMRVRWEY